MKKLSTLLALALLPTLHASTLIVPGTANPWLAGTTNGSTADGGCPFWDVAPEHSPVVYTPVVSGSVLTFSVTGSTHHGGDPFDLSPDGGPLQPHISENGMASNSCPISALVGVFLDDSAPNLTSAPNQFPCQTNALVTAPGLKQVFFIGDGLTGTGEGDVQRFVVPEGAKRLFLGTQDGCIWHDNGGSFFVTVETHPVAAISVSQVSICWKSLSNAAYQVQYRSTLTTNAWLDLSAPLSGNGTNVCATDAVLPSEAKRFYRVVLLP